VCEVGVALLVPALSSLQRLRKLNLSCIRKGNIVALTPALQRLAGLHSFTVADNELGVRTIRLLTPVLRGFTALQHLDVARNRISRDAAVLLAAPLAALTGLSCLDISSNPLGSAGLRALAPVVAALTRCEAWVCMTCRQAGRLRWRLQRSWRPSRASRACSLAAMALQMKAWMRLPSGCVFRACTS
jgi:Ran GTPase-activating protein (RanGAP) involved in mRNA processing and transport